MTTLAAESRFVQLPVNFLPALRHSLARGCPGLDAVTLMRRVGAGTGDAVWPVFEDWTAEQTHGSHPASLPAERFWKLLSTFFGDLGWGALHHSQLHSGVAALDSTDWAEADPASGMDQPGCHFTTGLVSDLLRRVVDRDVAVMEVECRSRGEERCRFLIGSPATLGALCGELREGAVPEDAISRLG